MIGINEQNMKLLLETMFSDASIEAFLNVCEGVIQSPLALTLLLDDRVWRSKSSKVHATKEGDEHARYVMGRLTQLRDRCVTRTQGGPGIPNGNYLCWAIHGKVRYGLIVIPRQAEIEIEDDLIVFIGQCLGQICARQHVSRLMTPDDLLDGLLKKRIESEAQLYAIPNIDKLIASLGERRIVILPIPRQDIQHTGSFISMHIHNHFEDVWCAWEDRGFLALIRHDKSKDRSMEKKLGSLAQALNCPICLGGTVESLIELPRIFARVMSIPALRNAQPGELIRAELYPKATLVYESGLPIKALQALMLPLVGEIEAYDAQNHTEYLRTIYTYMNSRFNATVTAQKLFIHTNTVFYRLDRIQELWGVDVLDADILYNLMLTFRLRKYQ